MDATGIYLQECGRLLERIREQERLIKEAADWFAGSILAGGVVHVFGSGHSRIMVEEMWPRYGSFPGFNPIVELSLTFHNLVVGSNGQRQAMFLENVSGLAGRILRNFNVSSGDSALIISSSGCSIVPVEMAELFGGRGVKVVSIMSQAHARASESRRPDGKKLNDVSDLVLDTGAPVGDAMVEIPGWRYRVSPGSTVGGCMLINSLKAEIGARLAAAGKQWPVLVAGAVAGKEAAEKEFEAAYDLHGRLLARLLHQAEEQPIPRNPG